MGTENVHKTCTEFKKGLRGEMLSGIYVEPTLKKKRRENGRKFC